MSQVYSPIAKEELDFVSEQTGIKDEDALQLHILDVQAAALHPSPTSAPANPHPHNFQPSTP
ncbi:hypothetical protein V8D89_014818 [Ganoderma adspersum]